MFGRGCIGGGGFQCWEPLKEIRSRGLSAAIFAPGWTYELPLREGTVATDWIPRENLFWRLLEGRAPSGTKYEKIIPLNQNCYFANPIFYQFSSNSFTNFSRQVSLETNCPIFVSRLQPTSPQPFLNFAGPHLECWRGRETRGLSGRLTTSLIFRTCFSLGRGLRSDPTATSSPPAAWFDLKKMEYQPNLLRTNEGENNEQAGLGEATRRPEDNSAGYLCHTTDTYSFKLSQSLQISVTAGQKITVPIFLVELEIEKDEEILFILDVKVNN